MAIRSTLLAEIRSTLGPAIVPNLTNADAAWDIFEAYVLSLVIQAAQSEGASVSFLDVQGNVPSIFEFRTSPGQIFSVRRNYCYAVIQFSNLPVLEIHMGIYVSGKSKVPHENDVVVIFQEEAEICRINQIMPRYSEVILAVECKFYSPGGLRLNLARSFMGLCQDISSEKYHFVTNTQSGSIGKLLAHHHKKWAQGIVPSGQNEVSVLKGKFQSAFKDFKARYS